MEAPCSFLMTTGSETGMKAQVGETNRLECAYL
jgi:hypothetical protein